MQFVEKISSNFIENKIEILINDGMNRKNDIKYRPK
jgi:hypothetical protein